MNILFRFVGYYTRRNA